VLFDPCSQLHRVREDFSCFYYTSLENPKSEKGVFTARIKWRVCLLGELEVEDLKCVSARQETRAKSHVTSKGEASKEEDEIVCSQKKKIECRAYTISL
jgi:hypothetical protein